MQYFPHTSHTWLTPPLQRLLFGILFLLTILFTHWMISCFVAGIGIILFKTYWEALIYAFIIDGYYATSFLFEGLSPVISYLSQHMFFIGMSLCIMIVLFFDQSYRVRRQEYVI